MYLVIEKKEKGEKIGLNTHTTGTISVSRWTNWVKQTYYLNVIQHNKNNNSTAQHLVSCFHLEVMVVMAAAPKPKKRRSRALSPLTSVTVFTFSWVVHWILLLFYLFSQITIFLLPLFLQKGLYLELPFEAIFFACSKIRQNTVSTWRLALS